MSEDTPAAVETDGLDTAAVLAASLSSEKTYLPEPKPAEAEVVVEPPGDDAAAAPTEAEAEKPKPKQSAQERIDELTRARREAERDVEYWKAKALHGSEQQPAQEAQQAPQGDERPVRTDYDDDFEFIEALTDWKAEQAAERLIQQQRQAEKANSVRANFVTRSAALFPDGEPAGLVAFKQLPQLPAAVIEIVAESEIGPKLAEHLGDNPAEFARLEGLSPIQQARELTRLEARLSPPSEAAKPPPKTITDAPEPPPQARGAGGQFKVAADTGDFAAFEKQYRIGG